MLILKTRAQPLHHGTLGIIRSLGRGGVPVYCSQESEAVPAAKSRYCSRDNIGVLSAEERELSIGRLKAFQSHVGRPLVIIAVDDNGALFLAENAEALGPEFLLPPLPPDLPRTVASKANHSQLCARAGVAVPKTLVVRAADELSTATAAIGYPAVVKIADPWLLPPDTPAVLLAHDQTEAAAYRSRLQARSSTDMVIQEFIPHDQAEDWFYHGYHRAGGEPVVGFTGRKLRSYPAFFGATSYGVSQVNLEVRTLAENLLRQLECAGVVELEFRFDKRDRQYKFVDFNPRPGAQFQFLKTTSGIDVVRALHLDLTGRPIPEGGQLEGCTFVSDFTDLAALMPYRRCGLVSSREWLKQVLGADDHAWFAWDDLAPFATACAHSVRRLFPQRRGRARLERTDPLAVAREVG